MKNETMIKVPKELKNKLMQEKKRRKLDSMASVIDYFFINQEEQSK